MNLIAFVRMLGYWGVWGMVLAESGLFMFFFPGDSLLFTAGLLASQRFFNLSLVIVGSIVFAIVGNSAGYYIGKKLGPKVFNHPKSWFLNKKRLKEAHEFYKEHGAWAILAARFVPVVRTFAPIVAGAARMNYHTFVLYNMVGAVVWVGALTLAGYGLGQVVPNLERYLSPIVALIILASLLPAFWHRRREKHKKIS